MFALSSGQIERSVQVQTIAAHLDETSVPRCPARSQQGSTLFYIGEARGTLLAVHSGQHINLTAVAIFALSRGRGYRAGGQDRQVGRIQNSPTPIDPLTTVHRDGPGLNQRSSRQAKRAVLALDQPVGPTRRTHPEGLGEGVGHHARCQQNRTFA